MYGAVIRHLLPPTLWLATRGGAMFSPKIRRGLRERRGLKQRLREHAPRLQGCVWIHAASAGEYEQARPILRALRERGDAPTYHSSFSPSGLDQARRHPEADAHELLDWDSPANAAFAMDTLRPRAMVFLKFDCWPNHVLAARERGIPLLLLDASFPPTSRRDHFLSRAYFAQLFDRFEHIGAIAAADAERFRRLGVTAPITITGDTKSEAVLARFEQSEGGELQAALRARPYRYVSLGSVWPQDEAVIREPLLRRLHADAELGLIAVPHEPHEAQLASWERALTQAGLPHVRSSRLATADAEQWRCILVDSVGQLAEIYRASTLAYVGGAFGDGVHNVLEPAICSQPVLFGPRHRNAAEAVALRDAGAAVQVRDVREFEAALAHWLDDEAERLATGRRARAFVLGQRGATERSMALLTPYLSR